MSEGMTGGQPPGLNPKPANPAGKFFGGLLVVAGVLICLLSGLCSVVFGAVVMGEGGGSARNGDIAGLLVVIAIFGGIPFMGGLVSTVVGVGLYRASRAKP